MSHLFKSMSRAAAGLLLAMVPAFSFAQPSEASQTTPSVAITSKRSIVHVGSVGIGINDAALTAAKHLLTALETKDASEAKKAADLFSKGYPEGKFGGEYQALQWFAERIAAGKAASSEDLTDPLTKNYFEFFAANDFEPLKVYINRHFELQTFTDDDPEKARENLDFLEDTLIFLSPNRTQWEPADRIVKALNLKSGARVADIGSGSGYYTIRFANLVGNDGHVYASDIKHGHSDFITTFTTQQKIDNITAVKSEKDDPKLEGDLDLVFMSSVYNLVYSVYNEPIRKSFVRHIRSALKPDGELVIVDFTPPEDKNLIQPGTYADKDLLIAQLGYFGFKLKEQVQLTPQRHLLRFVPADGDTVAAAAEVLKKSTAKSKGVQIPVPSEHSMIHIGSLDSFDITEGGVQAAKLVLSALETSNPEHAREAIKIYESLIPNENFGGEYTALQWFCEYIVASEAERAKFFEDKMVKAYFDYLAQDNFSTLKEYLQVKYKLKKFQKTDPEVGQTRRSSLEDFILFNNPKREEWEQTSKLMELLDIREGYKVADIGSGPGYFSYKFSRLVGDKGKVYALDIKQEHLDFIQGFIDQHGIKNIVPVLATTRDMCVNDKVDVAYMCSLYHVLYAVSSEEERQAYVESIYNTLKENGQLIIVDNGPVKDDELPYHGPYISKDLIITQMEMSGFKLEKFQQLIPQRYLLVFRKK